MREPKVNLELALKHGLTEEEYNRIIQILGRVPTYTELGIFSVMWSEHCCYKSSIPVLKTLPREGGALLVRAGEENAGLVDIGDGLAVAFKIESHNHPSAVEPYQGAATGVGGIMRDIFTMGARPIAALDSLRFGPLQDDRVKYLFDGVVRGIGDYGNCLSGEETVIVKDQGHVRLVKIEPYIEDLLRTKEPISQKIEILSFDLEAKVPLWKEVIRVFRRKANRVIQIKTTVGKRLKVTPDHPMIIYKDGEWVIKPASETRVGDLIPVMTSWPEDNTSREDKLNLIDLFKNRRIYLRSLTGVKAVTKIDGDFCRLMGHFLSEGCIFRKVIWNSGKRETQYATSRDKLLEMRITPSVHERIEGREVRGIEYSHPRHIDHGSFSTVSVVEVKEEVREQYVYDFEVKDTHTFITTGGIITHNCLGIPTVAGEVYFEDSYQGNPIVNAMTVGIVKHERIARAKATGPGNSVILIGSSTGRDGIHGATFASEEIDEESEQRRPQVQVGDPFTEKLLLEATLEMIKKGCVVGIQDMGAAGITCSTSEMAARGDSGMDIDLDKVPLREEGMTPYEIMLSESQERMLVVARRGCEEEIRRICQKWDLNAAVIGRVTEDGILRVRKEGKVVAEIPAKSLVLGGGAPVYHRKAQRPTYLDRLRSFNPSSLPKPSDFDEVLLRLISSPNIASKEWVYEQYDTMVRTNTVVLPGADAAVVRIKGTDKALAMKTDGNGRYCYLNPRTGGRIAVAEAARNVVCVGGKPLAITDCLNFGNPLKPEVFWQFKEVVEGIGEACRALGTPVTGGNVSFYNENPSGAIYPTPVIGMVGLVEKLKYVTTPHFKEKGDLIVLLGQNKGEVGGSEYLKVIHGLLAGDCPEMDLNLESRVQRACLEAIRAGIVRSAHDTSEGGLAVALAECCIWGRIGAHIEVDSDLRKDFLLFGEDQSRIILSLKEKDLPTLRNIAEREGAPISILGRVGGNRLVVEGLIDLEIDLLERRYREVIREFMER